MCVQLLSASKEEKTFSINRECDFVRYSLVSSLFFSVEFPRAFLTPRGVLCVFIYLAYFGHGCGGGRAAGAHAQEQVGDGPAAGHQPVVRPAEGPSHHSRCLGGAGRVFSSTIGRCLEPGLGPRGHRWPRTTSTDQADPQKGTSTTTTIPQFLLLGPPARISRFMYFMTPNPPKFSMFPRTQSGNWSNSSICL
jgi:hypothetical protein